MKQISSKPGPTADNTTEPTVARGHDSDNKAIESVESTPTIPSNCTWDSGYKFSIGNEAANDIGSDANSVLSTQKKKSTRTIDDRHRMEQTSNFSVPNFPIENQAGIEVVCGVNNVLSTQGKKDTIVIEEPQQTKQSSKLATSQTIETYEKSVSDLMKTEQTKTGTKQSQLILVPKQSQLRLVTKSYKLQSIFLQKDHVLLLKLILLIQRLLFFNLPMSLYVQ